MDRQERSLAANPPHGAVSILEHATAPISSLHFAAVAEPLAFRSLIRAGADNPAHRASVLVDTHHQCLYPEIVPSMEGVQRFLVEQGLQPGDCVTAELSNSLCSAVLILALLDGGYSVVLEQVPARGARSGGAMRFAKAFVSIRTDVPAQAGMLSTPSTYVQVRPNPEYDPVARAPRREHPRVYTRTSGSLGAAKIVVRTYERYRLNLLNMAARYRFGPAMRMALPTPIFHMFGLGSGLLVGVHCGVSIDLQERANVLRFLEREEEFNPNIAVVIPTFCETLVRARRTPRAYRFMLTGGDATSEATRRKSESLHGPLINAYGSSEMGFIATADPEAPVGAGAAGRLMPGVALRLLMQPSQASDSSPMGELQLKTAFQFEEYVDADGRRLELASAFDGDWFRTGDLARLDSDDTLHVLGRSDLSVNRNGLLLPFADVEARLREVEGVEEAAVVAGPERIRGRELVAFCVVSRQANLSPREIRDRYAARAPAYSVPDTVRIIDALPNLPSGKIDRRALAEAAQQTPEPGP